MASLPTAFWATFPDGNPTGDWSAIGPAVTLPPIQPGVPQIAEFDWANPSTMPENYAYTQTLLAIVSAPDDPDNPRGETSLYPSSFVPMRKWAAVKPVDISRVPNVATWGPTQGPSAGGTEVTINGTGFAGARVQMTSGNQSGFIEIVGPTSPPAAIDTMVIVKMPRWPLGGAVTLTVVTPAGTATVGTFSYA